MTDFTVIPAKSFHCGMMVRRMRAEHSQAHAMLGVDARRQHEELRASFHASCFRRAWLIDGQLAALGGVVGTALSAHGFIWLVLTDQARRYPVAVVKEARRQLAEVMVTFREIYTTVLPNDAAARRLAIFLGFHVAHDGAGQMAVSRAGRRTLAEFLDVEERCHVPMGNGHVIAMGYHHEGAA